MAPDVALSNFLSEGHPPTTAGHVWGSSALTAPFAVCRRALQCRRAPASFVWHSSAYDVSRLLGFFSFSSDSFDPSQVLPPGAQCPLFLLSFFVIAGLAPPSGSLVSLPGVPGPKIVRHSFLLAASSSFVLLVLSARTLEMPWIVVDCFVMCSFFDAASTPPSGGLLILDTLGCVHLNHQKCCEIY